MRREGAPAPQRPAGRIHLVVLCATREPGGEQAHAQDTAVQGGAGQARASAIGAGLEQRDGTEAWRASELRPASGRSPSHTCFEAP